MGGPCVECSGSGYIHADTKVACELCLGSGEV
jgi:hypothetical protein